MWPPFILSIIGITAAVMWGYADFFATKATRKTSSEAMAIWVSVINTFVIALIYLVYPGSAHWSDIGILYAVGAGISLEIGLYMLYRGLTIGPVSIVTPLSSAYPLITTLLIVVVFNEALSLKDGIGILITLIGLTVAAGVLPVKKSDQKINKGVLYGLAAFLLWGIAYACLSQAIPRIGWQKATLVDATIGLITLSIVLRLTSPDSLRNLLRQRAYKNTFLLATAFLQLIGGVVFSVGIEHARSSAVLTTISACYPALTIVLAIKYLGERRVIVPLVGSAITITGIVILSL